MTSSSADILLTPQQMGEADQLAVQAGGKSPPYEDWTKEELYDRAQEIGIEGRSDMTKDQLIEALRDH